MADFSTVAIFFTSQIIIHLLTLLNFDTDKLVSAGKKKVRNRYDPESLKLISKTDNKLLEIF